MDYYPSILEQVFALALLVFILSTAAISIRAYLRRPHDLAGLPGSAVLGPSIRGWYIDNLSPFEDFFVRRSVAPAYLSYAQLIGSVLVTVCYAAGMVFTAGWLLLCTGTLDIIDGRVARRTHGGSARGAFLDSVVDRYADSLAYLGLAIFFRTSWVLWVVLVAFLGTLMVSYVRARAEALGAECRVGLLQRPERYVILGFGCIFGALIEHMTPWLHAPHYWLVILTVAVLAVLSNASAVQRVVYVLGVLGDRSDA
ncbi:MAG: CDP-alcohol phosphatidyltransferase family protein [Candidatus Binatia bacterium]